MSYTGHYYSRYDLSGKNPHVAIEEAQDGYVPYTKLSEFMKDPGREYKGLVLNGNAHVPNLPTDHSIKVLGSQYPPHKPVSVHVIPKDGNGKFIIDRPTPELISAINANPEHMQGTFNNDIRAARARNFAASRGPSRRQASPPRRQASPPRRQASPSRRQASPPRRQTSPSRSRWAVPAALAAGTALGAGAAYLYSRSRNTQRRRATAKPRRNSSSGVKKVGKRSPKRR